MRYVLGGGLAWFLAMFQASSVAQVHVLGVTPNLLLVMLVCWLVVRGLDDVLPMVAVAGITTGFVALETPGVALLALLIPIVLLGVVRELHVVHSELLLVAAMVLVASVLYEGVMLLGAMATGGVLDPLGGLTDAVAPAALVNLALMPPVYFVMRFARPDARRRPSYLL